MSVYKKLIEVQTKLKAPKSQYNSFGKYSYRNCEDILEALGTTLSDFFKESKDEQRQCLIGCMKRKIVI